MRASVLAGVLAAVWAAPTFAQGASSGLEYTFFKQTTVGGCYFWAADFHDKSKYFASRGDTLKLSWESSACVAGQPINGQGRLREDMIEGGRAWWKVWEGRMVDGVWHGPVSMTSTYGGGSGSYNGGCPLDKVYAHIKCAPRLPAASASVQPAAAPGRSISVSDFDVFAADQLYTAVGELINRGDLDMARVARDALARRFPQSPLLPLAVELLVSNAPTGGQSTGAAPAAVSPAPVAPAANVVAPVGFQSKLDTFGAGQLFAFADELDQQGQYEMARAARRALISRFPDSQLAGTAAQQLAASAPRTAAAAIPAPGAAPLTPLPEDVGARRRLLAPPEREQ